ncbi:DUF305 domain-containing protein [Saccharopolyspora sp. NPDC002686]|uniref:DUF305 domain-containing protein n=1 Tax=Saccharopolyspora sp. NPDC002686 TaxID=3154541 RepID=UPI0033167F04
MNRRVLAALAALAVFGIGLLAGTSLRGGGDAQRTSPSASDVGFSQDMIVHHQQAVTMVQLVRGKLSPQVDAAAEAIAADQLREIGRMQGWLVLWEAPQIAEAPMSWMGGAHHHGETPMPGMASMPELNQLGSSTGTDADVVFLQLMIRHHQGGVDMAAAAAQQVSNPHVRDLANAIVAEQQQEIGTLTLLLQQSGAQPLPAR